jgi:hypothetical protein
VTAFFIPGVNGDEGRSEDVYRRLRRESELELGRSPRAQRIFRLWSRRGSVDCLTEVGRPDPLRGGTVIAIFDMGARQPFAVCRQQRHGSLSRDGTARSRNALRIRCWSSTRELKAG